MMPVHISVYKEIRTECGSVWMLLTFSWFGLERLRWRTLKQKAGSIHGGMWKELL